MAFADGIFTVTLLNIDNIGGFTANLADGDRVYFTADINGRFAGRSKRVARDADIFHFTADRDPNIWSRSFPVVRGQPIILEVTLVVDFANENASNSQVVITETFAALEADRDGFPSWRAGLGLQTIQAGFIPELQYRCRFDPTPAPPPPLANVARSVVDDLFNAVNDPPVVQITFPVIRGLYKPVNAPPPGGLHSAYVAGYTSDDDLGRIFVNRDLNGTWTRDVQRIELTARLEAQAADLTNAEVLWTVTIPDDPSDDRLNVHRFDGNILDPLDYGVSTDANALREHLGARLGDNDGAASQNPPWEQVPGFAMRNAAADRTITAVTQTGVSENFRSYFYETKVILHCPDAKGDRLIVAASLATAIVPPPFVIPAQTGIMTMWERIDVDQFRMNGALTLPVDGVPARFEPAFIQIDIANETVMNAVDRVFDALAGDDTQIEPHSAAYADLVFGAGTAGRFCLIAAKHATVVPPAPGATIVVNAAATIGRGAQYEFVDVPSVLAPATVAGVTLSWRGRSVYFNVFSPEPIPGALAGARLWLAPHDITDVFTGGNGSETNAYASTRNYSARGCYAAGAWDGANPGYDVDVNCQATCHGAGAYPTSGISPFRTVGVTRHFAGRTILFTHHGAFRQPSGARTAACDDIMESTIIHELTHAFGLPHKCGRMQILKVRGTSCCMNYENHWLLPFGGTVLTDNYRPPVGKTICSKHQRELRLVHLEDNPGLGW